MKGWARLLLVGLPLVAGGLGCDRGLGTCDITQSACQQDIYYRMLKLRGDGYDPFAGMPPVTVITEAEFRARLEKAAADAAATNGPNPWDTALGLLHFESPPGANPDGGADAGSSAIDDQVAHVLAFYSNESKSVTVIAHPSQASADPRESMVTLAHELVHALQDREMDLSAPSQPMSFDQFLARKGQVEGDARFYEYLFIAEVVRMKGDTPYPPTDMPDIELASAYSDFATLGSPFFAAEYFMYPLGAKYEAAAYRSGGNAAVRHAYANEPRHAVGFLVGDDGLAPPVGSGSVCSPPVVTTLPYGENAAGADQFGAVSWYTFLRGWGVDHATAFAAAQTWTGDFLEVQANADVTTTAVSWRLEFSSAPPASIAQALGASGELAVSTGTRSLEITVSDSPTPLVWQPTSSCP